jgi:hypothetical protein
MILLIGIEITNLGFSDHESVVFVANLAVQPKVVTKAQRHEEDEV